MVRKLYCYIITTDNGYSPCYDHELFSLSCCKPLVRRTILQNCRIDNQILKDEIWLCGIQRDAETKEPFIVYIAKIDKVLKLEEYYENPQYFYRKDCAYRNAKTIYIDNKLKSKLLPKEIRQHLKNLWALKSNEHDKLLKKDFPTESQCKDIYGASVLWSEQYYHCSNFSEDKHKFTKLLLPEMQFVLSSSENKTQGHWFPVKNDSDWDNFYNAINKVKNKYNAEKMKTVPVNPEQNKRKCKKC